MDDLVLAAMARWPSVPEVFGWLGLDRRGRWRLKGEPIEHAGLCAFISRNYACDDSGRHFFQNGPQRVFARLDYTPWVLRVANGAFTSHCGTPFARPRSAFIDEQGCVLVADQQGAVGLVDDRDLPALLDLLTTADGAPVDTDAVANVAERPLRLALACVTIPVTAIESGCVAARFGFDPNPQPPA